MSTDITTDATTEVTPEPEVKNPAALLAKNRALLDTVASLKSELQAANQALEAQTQRADALAQQLHELRVLRPWRAAITDLVGKQTAPAMQRCLDGVVEVAAGEDGEPVLLSKADGSPLMHEGKPVALTVDGLFQWIHHTAENGGEDLRPLLPRAVGIGATGNLGSTYGGGMPRIREPKPAPRKPSQYGLR